VRKKILQPKTFNCSMYFPTAFPTLG